MFSSIALPGFWAASHVGPQPFLLLILVLVYCPWWRSSHQWGLLSLHQLLILGPGFEHAPVLWLYVVEQWLGLHSYVIIGRMYFCYVVFKVDRAHPHLLPARRFKTLVRLETREAILSTWFFQFNLLSKVTPRYLNSLDWERAIPLYLNLGCIVLWARENDWKAVFEVFIFILVHSHHSSNIASALFSICSVFSSALLLSVLVQKTRSSAYSKHLMPEIEFSSPIRSFIYRLNKVQLVIAPCGSTVCRMWYLE